MTNKTFPWLYLGLITAQAAHSIEEVATGLWLRMPQVSGALHERIPLIPRVEWSREGFTVANLAIIALLACLSIYVFRNLPWAWKLARIVALIETINGIGHISAALISQNYFPGCISGVLLILLSIPLWALPRVRRIPNGVD